MLLKGFLSAITLMAAMFVLFATPASASPKGGGGCPQIEGFAIDLNLWYSYGECEYDALIPPELFCTTDADCGVGGGVGVVDDALLSAWNTCQVLSTPDAPDTVGICMPSIVGVECCSYGADEISGTCNPQPQPACSSNIDCLFEGSVCSAGDCVVADLNPDCDTNYDCRYSVWGPYCVKDATGQKYCQECVPPTTLSLFSLRGRVDTGCYTENSRPLCVSRNMGWQQGRPSFLCSK